MHKILRYYSQNRIKVWTTVFAIVFIIFVIQILNNAAKKEKNNTNKGETAFNVVSYHNESKSIITEGSVPQIYQKEFSNIIDEFYTYCINHEPEKAYELLAPDTKQVLYQTESQFENLYYQEIFEGNKEYSFQSWSSSSEDIYIYQVKIFDNMLATGKNNNEYIEDYVTIVPVEDRYKLNINGYIGRKNVSQKESNELITVEVVNIDRYTEHEIYTFRIKNNTDKTILLDANRKKNTTYITDEEGNKFTSFLYEIASQDLTFNAKEQKTIEIKFNRAYHNEIEATSVNFTDIVDADEYNQNESIEAYKIKIEI